MTLYVLFLSLTLVLFWSLNLVLRRALYKEWNGDYHSTANLIRSVVDLQFHTLSPQNAVAQSLVDFELKHKNLRASLMMVCFQKLGVILIGLLVALSLEWISFFAVLGLATILLAFTFKKPARWIQIFLMMGVFFWVYQGAFFNTSRVIFSPEYQDMALMMADGRLHQLLVFFFFSVLLTTLGRFEFWSVLISSILFFAGAIPLQTVFAMILGEAIGWGLYWYSAAHVSSQVSRTLFREKLLILIVAGLAFMSVILTWRSWGLLSVRILGNLWDKKILFLGLWALWEISVMVLYSIWGHFRSRSKILEAHELEPIHFPAGLLGAAWWGYKGWLPEQIQFRRDLIQGKVQRLEAHMSTLNAQEKLKFPPGFLDKTQKEVEALKSLLGSLPSDSV